MNRRLFINISVFLIVFLLVYTGVSKLLDYEQFGTDLEKSPIIPTSLVPLITFALPISEILLALALLSTRWRKDAFLVSGFLFVLFTLYLCIILYAADYVPCSCGGVVAQMSWEWHIVMNVFFILISFISYYFLPNENH